MSLTKLAATLCLATFATAFTAIAQDGPPQATAEHKILAAEEGTWDAKISSYMAGPDTPPAVSKGVEVNTLMPGGMFLISKFEGDMAGVKFEGRGHFGYDPLKKQYVGTWIDSMSPALTVLEGSYDAKTKTITYTGSGVDPMSKTKYTQKMATTTKDDGTRHFTFSMKSEQTGDKYVKFMEIVYTKRK